MLELKRRLEQVSVVLGLFPSSQSELYEPFSCSINCIGPQPQNAPANRNVYRTENTNNSRPTQYQKFMTM